MNPMVDKPYSKIPLIYLYIYKRLRENFNLNQEINYKYLIYRINKVVCHIPRKYYDIIIRELVDYKLISKLSGVRSPKYELIYSNFKGEIVDLNKIEKSTQKYKLQKTNNKKIIEKIKN